MDIPTIPDQMFFLIVLIQLILFTAYYVYELRKECE